MKKNFIFATILILALASLNFVIAFEAFTTPVLIVNNPTDSVYNSRTILFDLEADQESDFFVTKNIHRPAGWKILCRDTMGCEKEVKFREGDNRVLIKAVNSVGETITNILLFSIDTKKPKIHKIKPRRASYTNGTMFSVRYTEAQVDEITLFYGIGDSESKTNCESGKRKTCVFENVGLSTYDGQEIDYWFEIKDIAGNIGKSKKTKINVDTTGPKVHFYEYETVRRRVNFVFEIEEKNFKQISYIDHSDKNPRWKRLCSKFRNGRCDTKKSFRKGTHNLDIKVFDKAGNSEDIIMGETIVI